MSGLVDEGVYVKLRNTALPGAPDGESGNSGSNQLCDLVISHLYACLPHCPCPNPGPHPPWEMVRRPQAYLCSSVHHSILRGVQIQPVKSEGRPQGAEWCGGTGGASRGAWSFTHSSATNCLLSPLPAIFPLSFHPGAGRGRVGTRFRPKLPRTGPYLPPQHRGPSLIGVGCGASSAPQVRSPEAPWLSAHSRCEAWASGSREKSHQRG